MANKADVLASRSAEDAFGSFPKMHSTYQLPMVFGTDASESTLGPGYPVGINSSTLQYGAWIAPDPTVLVIDLDGSTGGTFSVTVNGVASADLAFGATAADVAAALLDIGYSASTDLAAEVHTITFDAAAQTAVLPTVVGGVGSLTGGTTPTAVTTAGTATLGLDQIRGFVWLEEIVLDDTLTVQGVVMIKGEISFDVIEALIDSGDVAACTAACKVIAQNGLIVRDIANIV